MNVAAIGAHPDDVEMGAAGTLARHVNKGDKVYIVHMVNTGYYDPISNKVWRTDCETREQAERAAEVIGAQLHMLNFKDRNVPFNEESVVLVDKFLREHKVDVVYTHWSGDSHQDHQNTLKTVLSATRYIGNIYLFETVPLPRVNLVQISPSRYVDIEKYMDAKMKAVGVYKSEHDKFREGYVESIIALARYRGAQCGRKYAEAFEVTKEVI